MYVQNHLAFDDAFGTVKWTKQLIAGKNTYSLFACQLLT